MSLLYAFKPRKDALLESVCGSLISAGVTPNMVTAAGLLLAVASGLLAGSGHLYAGLFLFLSAACLDALDGSLARLSGRCSEFGRYFDSFSDRCAELVFIAGAVAGGASPWALLVAAGSLLLLWVRVYNHLRGLDSDAAMFGRPERLALLVAGLLVPTPYGVALFVAAGCLSLVSAVQALASGLRGKAKRPAEAKVISDGL